MAFDGRQVFWVWLHLVAILFSAHVCVGLGFWYLSAPDMVQAVFMRHFHMLLQPLIWSMIAVAFCLGAYGGALRWTWVALAALGFVQIFFAFLGYVLPFGQVAFWFASQGIPVSMAELGAIFPAVSFLATPVLILAQLRIIGCASTEVHFWGRYSKLGLAVFVLAFVSMTSLVWQRNAEIWTLHDQLQANSESSSQIVSVTRVQATVDQTSPLTTPAHIVPEWYFLPFYAVLRAAPDKLGGVLGMIAFSGIWMFLPWLDRGNPKPFWLRRRICWMVPAVAVCVAALGGAGAAPAEGAVYRLSQLCTVVFFALLLIALPWASKQEAMGVTE